MSAVFMQIEESGGRLSGIVFDSRSRDCGFEPNRGHCAVSLSKTLLQGILYLVLIQLRRKESIKQTKSCSGKSGNQLTLAHGGFHLP